MKKHLMVWLALLVVLAACAPQAQPTEQGLLPNDDSYSNPGSYPDDSYPNDNTSAPDAPVNWTPAQQAAVTALSQSLNLPPGQIALLTTEAVEWRDGCLEIQREGVMCTQALVPGYRMLLDVNGVQYEVRTNEDGSSAVVVPFAPEAETVEEELILRLAQNLGLKPGAVSLLTVSEIEFSDTCLGVALPDVNCAQALTPGKLIVLEAQGVQYSYHTSADGAFIQPADLVLTWKREGGIAGFCDTLMVFRSGEIVGSQCKSQPVSVDGTFASTLTAEERAQLDAWVQEVGTVAVDASDPDGVSDRMVVTVNFTGEGQGSLTPADEQDLVLWAQAVFQKLFS
jgi:hypothetical protein